MGQQHREGLDVDWKTLACLGYVKTLSHMLDFQAIFCFYDFVVKIILLKMILNQKSSLKTMKGFDYDEKSKNG